MAAAGGNDALIAAIAVGIVYSKTVKWNRFFSKNSMLCSGIYFFLSMEQFLFSTTYHPTEDEIKFKLFMELGYTGMATALLVSIILNHKKKRKYLSS